MQASYLIKKLKLEPHPEGGYYKETYRCEQEIPVRSKQRNVSTAIYFLLENDNKSHFHKIKSDELWFYHQGETLEILLIENGELRSIFLGNNVTAGEVPQAMVPANTWFASRMKYAKGYALVSCTVAPGFDFEDFEMGKKSELLKEFPTLGKIIGEMSLE